MCACVCVCVCVRERERERECVVVIVVVVCLFVFLRLFLSLLMCCCFSSSSSFDEVTYGDQTLLVCCTDGGEGLRTPPGSVNSHVDFPVTFIYDSLFYFKKNPWSSSSASNCYSVYTPIQAHRHTGILNDKPASIQETVAAFIC